MPGTEPEPTAAETPVPEEAPRQRVRRSRWPWLAAALSGLLLALCFPPFEQTYLVWVALCPLICALWFGAWPLPLGKMRVRSLEEARAEALPENQPRLGAGRAFLFGWVAGLLYFGITLFWLVNVHVAAWLTLPLYLAVYPGLWAMFFNAFCQPRERWGWGGGKFALRGQALSSQVRPVWLSSTHNLWLALLAAAAWVALEWVRGSLLSGFGWNGLGVATHDNPALMQASGLVGVAGLALPIVVANVVTVATVNRFRHEVGRFKIRPHLDFSLTMALIVIWFSYGTHLLFRPDAPEKPRQLKVALIQPNIPQERKWNPSSIDFIFNQFRPLTLAAAAMKPDLVIWPEAATPGGLFSHRASRQFWEEMRGTGSFNFLIGTNYDIWPDRAIDPHPVAPAKSYNSAFLTRRTGDGYQVYNKIHLVPFGEMVPLRKEFPPLAWLLRELVPEDFDAGAEHTLLRTESPEVALAPLICFEDTVPDLARRFIGAGGELFVNITNDGWFGQSAAPRQHLLNSAFRCAENRRPMVRCANTGVSAFIDEYGRIKDILADEKGNTFVTQMRIRTVSLPAIGTPPVVTLYTRWGDWFAMTCLGMTTLYGVFVVTRRIIARRRAVERG